MLRIVLDTNIVVSACLTPAGIPATLVELAILDEFRICISPAMLREYRDVLARPKFSRQMVRIQTLLDWVDENATLVHPPVVGLLSPDAAHNHVIACAEEAEADFLVTGNRKHFPDRIGSTKVLSPRELLDQLGV